MSNVLYYVGELVKLALVCVLMSPAIYVIYIMTGSGWWSILIILSVILWGIAFGDGPPKKQITVIDNGQTKTYEEKR
jgi:hypothetical protein